MKSHPSLVLAYLFIVQFCILILVDGFSLTASNGNCRTTGPTTRFETVTTSTSTTASKTSKLHLLSLQYTPPNDPGTFSEVVTTVWRWKDTVLGNGQDFFVPKPKTLTALQDCLLAKTSVDEVVVISNCARLELLIFCCNENIVDIISRELLRQVQYHQEHPHTLQLGLGWDMPTCIATAHHQSTLRDSQVNELSRYWTHYTDLADITRHLCLIASGMANRPRRPIRPVPFQPFSSRDAHVLLQLKRTLDVCRGRQTSILLKGALEAGKAVRNDRIVSELQLLQQYGTGDNKYSVDPPSHVLELVTQAAMKKGIQPAIEVTLERLSMALDEERTQRIVQLRRQADNLALNADESAFIQKRLHEPTMRLREGSSLQIDSVLAELQSDLKRLRGRRLQQAYSDQRMTD
ncbi:hypothetical protein MPSEU_000778600 [Mayamaea pseudoterrestris]|nr:hypothetical protein MPSEU_000778600 [Mayamaea pseudoterrestris]